MGITHLYRCCVLWKFNLFGFIVKYLFGNSKTKAYFWYDLVHLYIISRVNIKHLYLKVLYLLFSIYAADFIVLTTFQAVLLLGVWALACCCNTEFALIAAKIFISFTLWLKKMVCKNLPPFAFHFGLFYFVFPPFWCRSSYYLLNYKRF